MSSSSAAPAERAGFVAAPLRASAPRFEPAAGERALLGAAEAVAREPSLEELRQEAFEAGRAAGRAELPWRDADALRSALISLEEAARALGGVRRDYLMAQRRALVELALAVAERVLGRAVAADPDALVAVVERALAQLGADEPVRLRLCAGHLETLELGLAPQLARLAAEHGVRVEADRELVPGDVRVFAGRSQVDARLEECLRRVRDELSEAIDADEDGR